MIPGIKVADKDGDDPIWLSPASPFYVSMFPSGLTKEEVENIQILDWVTFMKRTLRLDKEADVLYGEDPPDRILKFTEGTVGVELRQLTLEHVRRELAPLRDIGLKIQRSLSSQPDDYKHLLGKLVQLSTLEPKDLNVKELQSAIPEILELLKQDVGFVGEGFKFNSDGSFPKVFPESRRGFYGKIKSFVIQAYPDGISGSFQVSCSIQTQIRQSEALQAIKKAITDKDIAGNDVVLITCGLPDEKGYVCPLDNWLYQHLTENRAVIKEWIEFNEPTFIKNIIVRLWHTNGCMDLYRKKGIIIPWSKC